MGGGVRDLLVGLKPKDFDIATNALPNEVKKKVPYSFIIGRRFKLVHAKRGEKIFEVATYRREATQEELNSTETDPTSVISGDNFFGNLKNNDNVKLLGEKMKGNIGLISGQITIYL